MLCVCACIYLSMCVSYIRRCMCIRLCACVHLYVKHCSTVTVELIIPPHTYTAHDIIAVINDTPVILLLLLLSEEETISDVRSDEAHHVNILQS